MAKRKQEESSGGDWMSTYSDMVTLLLCFFAVMLSMSSTDAAKFQAFVNSLQMQGADIVAVDPPGDAASQEEIVQGSIDNLYAYMKEYIEENGQTDEISLSKQDDMVFIRFQNDMFFMPDSDTLRPESQEAVTFIANGLKQFESVIRTVNICGHTAKTGRTNSAVSDWRLSGERAATFATILENQAQFPSEKIVSTGYGANYPVASNDTEEGRSKNRRVELIVVGVDSTANADFYAELTNEYGGSQNNGGVADLLDGGANMQDNPSLSISGTTGTTTPVQTGTPQITVTNPQVSVPDVTGRIETGVSPYDD